MVRMQDIESGLRPQISEREFAALRGCSRTTLQKDRVRGKGTPFLKDPVTGRIAYAARDVLAYFARSTRCRSTSECSVNLQG